MPWTAASFRTKHNTKLSAEGAIKAAAQANAVLKAGVPEGEAIAIANKEADRRAHTSRASRLYGKGK